MLISGTLKNGTSRVGLYGSAATDFEQSLVFHEGMSIFWKQKYNVIYVGAALFKCHGIIFLHPGCSDFPQSVKRHCTVKYWLNFATRQD